MADGTSPPRLSGKKPAVDKSLPPFVPTSLPPGYIPDQFQPTAAAKAGVPQPDPMRDQKSQLEAQIRQIESTGGNASQLRAQLASVYDQMNPNWRAQSNPNPNGASGMPRPATPLPGVNLDTVPTRWDQYKNPDGSLNVDAIQPVDGSKFNTSTTLMTGIDAMFKGTPNDDLNNLAYKIEGRSKVRSDIAPLLQNPDEAVSALVALMNQFGGNTMPSQTLGAEEKAYIEAAFQVAPGRKFATIDDIPDDYINFALGYGLVGMAQGDGLRGFTDAATAGLANAQQGLDQTFAQDTAQFEAQRALNMALANRQGKIADANFQQEGFFAKDMRDLAEKVTTATQTLDRQAQLAMLSTIMPMIQNGDSDRYNAYVETVGPSLKKNFGITLPKVLPKSSKENETDAKIASMGIKDERLKQVIRFAEDMEPLKRDELMTRISLLDGQDEMATQRVALLQKQVAGYDKKLAAEIMLIGVKAESLKTQAQAALERAKKGGTPASDPRIKQLQAIAGVNASAVSGLAKQQDTLIKQIAADRDELNQVALLRTAIKDNNSKITFDAREQNAKKRIADNEKKLQTVESTLSSISQAQLNAAALMAGEKK
jgi:hypothetical protein